MADLHYLELNLMQIYDVLRNAERLHLAVCGDAQPYVIPMRYQLEVAQDTPILHLVCPAVGRKVDALRRNALCCAEIDLPGCAWLDTVLIEGRVRIGVEEGMSLHLLLRADRLSGRRYYLPSL